MTRLALLFFLPLFTLPGTARAGKIADLVPQLRHADTETRRAAQREVARIAHEASRPYPTVEVPDIASRDLVAALTARPRLPSGSVDAVMRALARTTKDAASIEALARLTTDPQLGDRAYETLGAIPHPRAVRELLLRLDDDRALLVLREQAERIDDDGVGALLAIAVEGDPARGAAARRALAATGHPAAAPLLARASGRGLAHAGDDLLRWAERTSDPAAAARAYRTLLSATAPHLRAAGVHGLGRLGEGADILAIASRLDDEDPTVRGAARETLVRHPHEGVGRLLEGLFDAPGSPRRSELLTILVRRGGADASTRVLSSLDAEDDGVRRTALTLSANILDPGLPDRLLEIARRSDGEVRDAALGAVLEHARRRVIAGDDGGARELLHRALASSGSAEFVRDALGRLAGVADASSLTAVERFDAEGGRREELAGVRLAVGRRLLADGDDRARAILDRVVVDTRSRDRRNAALAGLSSLGVDVSTYPKRSGFLTEWRVIGPFPEATEGDLGEPAFPVDPADFRSAHDGKQGRVSWTSHETGDAEGLVDFVALIGGEHATAYAATEFFVPGGAGRIAVGSDDGVAIWLNGTLVHRNFTWRGVRADEDVIDVRFEDGPNRLIAKVTNGGGGWGLCVRVTDATGKPHDLRAAEF